MEQRNNPFNFIKKSNERWLQILSTFDPVKDDHFSGFTKKRKQSYGKNSIQKCRHLENVENANLRIFRSNSESVFFDKLFQDQSNDKSTSNNKLLSEELLTTLTKNKDFQRLAAKEDIPKRCEASSSKIQCSQNLSLIKHKKILLSKRDAISFQKSNSEENDIIWTSSDEDSSYITVCNKKKNDKIKKPADNSLAIIRDDTRIHFSSTNKSNGELSLIDDYDSHKDDSQNDLNLFVKEIKKDLHRNNKIKHKYPSKKSGFFLSFRSSINKAKSDVCFLDYEQREGILSGIEGIVLGTDTSYGASTATVKLENGSESCIFLSKPMRSINIENNVVLFIDYLNFYKIENTCFYIQPNKIVKVKNFAL